MLKRCVLVCLTGSLLSLSALAAEEAKSQPAQPPAATAKAAEAAGKIAAAPQESTPASRKKANGNKSRRDLGHCLNRTTNAEVIRCVE